MGWLAGTSSAGLGAATNVTGPASTGACRWHPRRDTAANERRASAGARNAHPQPDWSDYTGPVPILVYHELGAPPAGRRSRGCTSRMPTSAPRWPGCTATVYQAVTLDEMMKRLVPPRHAAAQADRDHVRQRLPAAGHLRAACDGAVRLAGSAQRDHRGPPPSAPDPTRSCECGWEVDSHSLTHPDLTNSRRGRIAGEVGRLTCLPARTRSTSRPTASVIRPAATTQPRSRPFKAAGYTNATTENPGYATSNEAFTLPRFEIESGVSELEADLLDNQPAAYASS